MIRWPSQIWAASTRSMQIPTGASGSRARFVGLTPSAATELDEQGFIVIPDAIASPKELSDAYDAAMASATADDTRVGRTSTKVTDFVNRGATFDDVYLHPSLLDACGRVIGGPFKLSSLHGRRLRPGASAQELHVDAQRYSADWPLVGFILMVDEFRPDNGATRFVPGSHRWPGTPEGSMSDVWADHDEQVLACGAAGSLLVFNGSTWHGHSANRSHGTRRSIQGAFIPREGRAAVDFDARMNPYTRARLSALAKRVLALSIDSRLTNGTAFETRAHHEG
jgi:hypothetical protein